MMPGAVLVLIHSSVRGGVSRPPVALRGCGHYSTRTRTARGRTGTRRGAGAALMIHDGVQQRGPPRCSAGGARHRWPREAWSVVRSTQHRAAPPDGSTADCTFAVVKHKGAAIRGPGPAPPGGRRKEAAVERTDPAVGTASWFGGIHPRAQSCVERKALTAGLGQARVASGPARRYVPERAERTRGGGRRSSRPSTPRPRGPLPSRNSAMPLMGAAITFGPRAGRTWRPWGALRLWAGTAPAARGRPGLCRTGPSGRLRSRRPDLARCAP